MRNLTNYVKKRWFAGRRKKRLKLFVVFGPISNPPSTRKQGPPKMEPNRTSFRAKRCEFAISESSSVRFSSAAILPQVPVRSA
jgi:hypothetical protein